MPSEMNVCVILPAAGASKRFREGSIASGSKLDEDLGGRPLLQRTVELFDKRPEVGSIVVAGPHDEAAFAEFELRHADRLTILGAILCRGGATHRYETVAAALGHVPDNATHVAVHDAARPCTPADLIDRVFAAAASHDAVLPAIDVPDTIKRVTEPRDVGAEPDPLGAILTESPAPRTSRFVEQTLERRNLVAVQTPQVFTTTLLRRAYAQADLTSTDDAQLVERLGEPVLIVEGDSSNLKVTRPSDIHLARAIGGFPAPRDRPTHKKF